MSVEDVDDSEQGLFDDDDDDGENGDGRGERQRSGGSVCFVVLRGTPAYLE